MSVCLSIIWSMEYASLVLSTQHGTEQLVFVSVDIFKLPMDALPVQVTQFGMELTALACLDST